MTGASYAQKGFCPEEVCLGEFCPEGGLSEGALSRGIMSGYRFLHISILCMCQVGPG